MPHGDGGQTKVQYRIAWALTYLKKIGLIDNSTRGVWSLINPGKLSVVDAQETKTIVRKQLKCGKMPPDEKGGNGTIEEETVEENWQSTALKTIQAIPPDAFERLCQRLLRESGFIEVIVSGKSNDGGIDGHGILQLAGLVSFRVLFQSKRYQGSVVPSQIRDFRGAMIGRADRGLFMTTGTFTKDAQKEATRDGAPIIDLIDGELLVEKLKEYRLGIDTQMVEEVVVQKDWFDKL